MALFRKKTKESDVVKEDQAKPESKKVVKKTAPKVAKEVKEISGNFSWVLKKPRITEKASIVPETSNAYVFQIDPRATKSDVKKAIQAIYKVSPKKINVLKIHSKKVVRRKRSGTSRGVRSGGKKAYVYLNKGDKIELV